MDEDGLNLQLSSAMNHVYHSNVSFNKNQICLNFRCCSIFTKGWCELWYTGQQLTQTIKIS